MSLNHSDELFQSEENYKEKVYSTLENNLITAKEAYLQEKYNLDGMSVDKHDAFMYYDSLSQARVRT